MKEKLLNKIQYLLDNNKIDNIMYAVCKTYINQKKYLQAIYEIYQSKKKYFIHLKTIENEKLIILQKEKEKEKNNNLIKFGMQFAKYQYMMEDGNIQMNTTNNQNNSIKNSFSMPADYMINQRGIDILGGQYDSMKTNSLFYKYADNYLITWRPFDIARLLKSNSIVKNAILIPINDAFMEYDIICQDKRINEDDINLIKKEYLNLHLIIVDSIFKAKAYGGSCIVFYGDSHQDLSEPLQYKDNNKIRCKNYDKWWINTQQKAYNLNEIQQDLEKASKENNIEILKQYEIKEQLKENYIIIEGKKINKSRVLLLKNQSTTISNLYSNMLLGFGFSEFEDKRIALSNFLNNISSISQFINQKRFFALKTPDMLTKSSMGNDDAIKSLEALNTFFQEQINNNDLLNIDTLQDIQQVIDNTDTGQLFDSATSMFAMQMEIPKSRLIGNGLKDSLVGGSTGDNENERIYRCKLQNLQNEYKEIFNITLKLISLHILGNDYNFEISFERKNELSSEQKEVYKTNKINMLVQLKTAGIISNEVVIDNINNDKTLDLKLELNTLDNDIDNLKNNINETK